MRLHETPMSWWPMWPIPTDVQTSLKENLGHYPCLRNLCQGAIRAAHRCGVPLPDMRSSCPSIKRGGDVPQHQEHAEDQQSDREGLQHLSAKGRVIAVDDGFVADDADVGRRIAQGAPFRSALLDRIDR